MSFPRLKWGFFALFLIVQSAARATAGDWSIHLAATPEQEWSGGNDVRYSSRVVIAQGEVRRRGIVCFSCDVTVDGEIRRDLVVIGGRLTVQGTAGRNVVGILSDISVGPNAAVQGDLVSIASHLSLAAGADLEGDLVDIPGFGLERLGRRITTPDFGWLMRRLWSLWAFLRLIGLMVLLLVLIVISALCKDTIMRAGNAVPELWLPALLIGLVTYVAAILVGIVLCVTIIGIPAAILLFFAVKVTKWIGMGALFYFVGDRIAHNLLRREFNLLGSMVLAFVVYAAFTLVPLLGWLVAMVVAWIAVGLMITTRYGTGKPWFPATAVPPVPPQPPALSTTPSPSAAAENR